MEKENVFKWKHFQTDIILLTGFWCKNFEIYENSLSNLDILILLL
ncbi:hypothetical protein SZ39_1002 [Bacillus mycoides]|nr:hypothetical protein SZ39_1002 [Bacillus mycoides]